MITFKLRNINVRFSRNHIGLKFAFRLEIKVNILFCKISSLTQQQKYRFGRSKRNDFFFVALIPTDLFSETN